MRLTYPTNLKIIKLPCSGRVDIIHLMEAVEKGADGVIVAGVPRGELSLPGGEPSRQEAGCLCAGASR